MQQSSVASDSEYDNIVEGTDGSETVPKHITEDVESRPQVRAEPSPPLLPTVSESETAPKLRRGDVESRADVRAELSPPLPPRVSDASTQLSDSSVPLSETIVTELNEITTTLASIQESMFYRHPEHILTKELKRLQEKNASLKEAIRLLCNDRQTPPCLGLQRGARRLYSAREPVGAASKGGDYSNSAERTITNAR
ncbi:hypothetical protein Bbelb_281430 [Branchiostoma belcheri]|nr:hypothetical protein Bbelb_281430 [Branchiostoma belcheri]